MALFRGILLALLAMFTADAAGLANEPKGDAKISSPAQTGEVKQQDAEKWIKLCFSVKSPDGAAQLTQLATAAIEACYTYVSIRDQPTNITIGYIGVLQIQALDRNLLVALLPLGSAMPPEPGFIRLDGNTRIKLAYLIPDTCDQAGCHARAELTEDLIDKMKAAKEISFGNLDIFSGRELTIPLSCCSFAQAFDGAPLPIEAKNETQRRMQEALQRRFMDFIR